MIHVRKLVETADKEHLWEYSLPNKGAREEDIKAFEENIGFTLPKSYRNFFKLVNGWKSFWHGVDLFSISDYKNESLMEYTNEILETIETEEREALFPIGITVDDLDFFVIIKPGFEGEGEIIWFAGYEIERYKDCNEFLNRINKLFMEDITDFKKID